MGIKTHRHILLKQIGLGLLLFSLPFTAMAMEKKLHYTDSQCGIAFDYPSQWKIRKVPVALLKDTAENAYCGVILEPPDLAARVKETGRNAEDHYVTIYTFKLPFKQTATEEADFEKQEGSWVVLGRMGASAPAETISSDHWIGVKGIQITGCYYSLSAGGGYAGLCERELAVLNNRHNYSAEITGNPFEDPEAGDLFLQSFRFIDLAANK